MPNGSLGPSFASTSLIPAVPSALVTGVAQGSRNSTLKTIEILDKCKNAADVLKTIQESIKELKSEFPNDENQFSGLDIYRDSLNADDIELFPVVDFTRKNAATIPQLASQAAGLIVSNGVQTVTDTFIGTKVGLSNTMKSPDKVFQASKVIDDARKNFFACSKHFMREIEPLTNRNHQEIKKSFAAEDHSILTSHELGAISTADALSSVIATPTLVMSLLWDTVGVFLRNCQVTVTDISKSNMEHADVINALNECIKSMTNEKPSKESCFESLEKLNNLIAALSDMKASEKEVSDELITGGEPFTKLSSFATIPFISSLKLMVDSTLAFIIASEVVENIQLPGSKALSKQASSLEAKNENLQRSHSHSKNITSLTQQVKLINQALQIAVDENQILKKDASDASSVLGAGTASVITASTVALLPILVLELGSITRELAAGIHFFDVGNKKIFDQSDVVSKSDENMGEELDKLFIEASKLRDAIDMAKELGASSPFSLGLARASIIGGTVGSLNLFLGALSAVREMRSLPTAIWASPAHSELKAEEKKKVADSINKIKQTHQKASSALTTSAPKAVTSENALESILNKVILAGRISKSDPGEAKDRKDLNSVGKASVGAENSSASALTQSGEFLTGALSAVALVFLESGISIEALLRASGNTLTDLIHECANIKQASEGPDKTKITGESGTNLSFLCNALRLLAESKSKDLPSSQMSVFGTASLLESITSRSLTLFLLHSGILSDALDDLTRRHEVADDKSQSRKKSKASAKEEVISGLAKAIEERLNNIDAKQIPGLNKDMASQLQSVSQQRIASALSTEMTLIEPFIVLTGMMAEGSKGDVEPRHDHEALVDSSPSKEMSILSNMIQGFTLACIDAADRMDREPDRNQSLLKSHHSSRQSDKTTFKSSGYISLSLVESIGTIIGRAFTLLDSKKISEKSELITQHTKEELEGNLNLSSAAVKADSHLGQADSAIYSISAVRSTLTHLCAALKECADELAAEVNKSKDDDFVKDGLKMHTSQASLMRSMATALTTCASLITRMLATGSGISFSHIILLGKVDEAHQFIHSRDDSLEIYQNNSSQKSSKSCGSDTCIVTGLSSDLAISTVTNLTKILLKAALLGSDIFLSVSKILEILLLDVHPEERLKNELQALSVPNIGSNGSIDTIRQQLTALEVIPTISTGQACVTHDDPFLQSTLESSFISLQNKVDKMINRLEVLDDKENYGEDFDHDKENIKGLKGYIHHIIKTLEPVLSDKECRLLVDKLNKGGITLSNYHKKYGGILNAATRNRDRKSELYRLSKIDDTKALIDKFINEMFIEYSRYLKQEGEDIEDPLKRFNQTLGQSLTHEAEKTHNYIIHSIANKLYESNNLLRSSFWHGPRTSFNRDGFITRYTNIISHENKPSLSLESVASSAIGSQPSAEVKHVSPATEINTILSEVEEARRRRIEKRTKSGVKITEIENKIERHNEPEQIQQRTVDLEPQVEQNKLSDDSSESIQVTILSTDFLTQPAQQEKSSIESEVPRPKL